MVDISHLFINRAISVQKYGWSHIPLACFFYSEDLTRVKPLLNRKDTEGKKTAQEKRARDPAESAFNKNINPAADQEESAAGFMK
jgi:hypothetical protein